MINITGWGAQILAAPEWEEFSRCVSDAANGLRRDGLVLGDVINWYHENREGAWGELYDDLMAVLGLSYEYLANAKSNARIVPFEYRNPKWQSVRPSHFRAVRTLETIEERVRALDVADAQKMDYETLRGYVRALRGEPIPPPKARITVVLDFSDKGLLNLARELYRVTNGCPGVVEAVRSVWNERGDYEDRD